MRVLFVEDSEKLQRSVTLGLRKAGFKVDATGDGQQGLWRALSFDYDVIVLDLMLPGLDGLSILREFRKQNTETAVLILSARDAIENRVEGLSQGADDYLVKPFAFEELEARLRALVRRRYGIKSSTVSLHGLQIDFSKKEVRYLDEVVPLPPREYALLELLILKRGTVVSRQKIAEHIYDEIVEPSSNVVDAAVCNLRKLLDNSNESKIIKTKRGQGYIIE